FHDLTNDCAVPSPGMVLHHLEQVLSRFGRNNSKKFAFVGDIERVQPQHLTRGSHLSSDWDARLFNANADARSLGQFVECTRHSSTRRIAHPPNSGTGLQHNPGQIVQRSSVTFKDCFKLESFTDGHYRNT